MRMMEEKNEGSTELQEELEWGWIIGSLVPARTESLKIRHQNCIICDFEDLVIASDK